MEFEKSSIRFQMLETRRSHLGNNNKHENKDGRSEVKNVVHILTGPVILFRGHGPRSSY